MSASLRKLRYFEAAVRNGSISKAAEELHVSQSSISVAIKEFEQYLGVALVERSQRGITPTHNGRIIYGESKQICGRIDRIKRLVQNSTERLTGNLRVSVSSSILGLILPVYISEFVFLHPGIDLRIENKEWPDFQEELISGGLDLAFNAGTSHIPKNIEVHRLVSFSRKLWVNSQNPLVEQDFIRLEDLSGQRVFIYEYDYAVKEFKDFANKIEESGAIVEKIHEVEAMRRLVQADVGVCVLSDLSYESDKMASKNVLLLPFELSPPPFEVAMYKSKKKGYKPELSAFISHLLSRVS